MHKAAYKCSWSFRGQLHSKNSQIDRCYNPQVKSELLETRVLSMVKDVLLNPERLRECMDFSKEDTWQADLEIEKELKSIHESLTFLREKKSRIIDVYASGDLSRDAYVEKSREYDGAIEALRERSKQLTARPALIDAAIAHYCAAARLQFADCADFTALRQFLLDHVTKVVYSHKKVWLHGRVPIRLDHHGDTETTTLPFCIESEITKEERRREKLRAMEAMRNLYLVATGSQGHTISESDHVLSALR